MPLIMHSVLGAAAPAPGGGGSGWADAGFYSIANAGSTDDLIPVTVRHDWGGAAANLSTSNSRFTQPDDEAWLHLGNAWVDRSGNGSRFTGLVEYNSGGTTILNLAFSYQFQNNNYHAWTNMFGAPYIRQTAGNTVGLRTFGGRKDVDTLGPSGQTSRTALRLKSGAPVFLGHELNRTSTAPIPFSTVRYDTASAWNTGSRSYVVPQDGYYFVCAQWWENGGTASTLSTQIYRNNDRVCMAVSKGQQNGDNPLLTAASIIKCDAGDLLSVERGNFESVANTSPITFFSIAFLDTHADFCGFRALAGNGQTFPPDTNNDVFRSMALTSVDYDTHSGYDTVTGRYTVPTTGYWFVYGAREPVQASGGADLPVQVVFRTYAAGVPWGSDDYAIGRSTHYSSNGGIRTVTAGGVEYLTAGDEIEMLETRAQTAPGVLTEPTTQFGATLLHAA